MRLTTVAVLYNDALDQIAKEYPGLAAAMKHYGRSTEGWEGDGHFHTGRIVSMDAADATQVVVVDHNNGERITETSASPEALEALAFLLSRHGYDVKRRERAGLEPSSR